MRSLTLFIVLFVTCVQQVSGQEEIIIQDYILFNNYPYFVSMNQDGDILEFIKTAPEKMKGASFDYTMAPPMPLGPYNKPKAEYKEFISPLNETIVSDQSGNAIEDIALEVEETTGAVDMVMQKKAEESKGEKTAFKPKEETTFKTNVIRVEKEEDMEPEVIVKSQDNLENNNGDYNYDMKFPGFNARLTPELINTLEDISKIHENNPTMDVEIRSFITAGDPTNKQLAENRMNACKDLLETYGVPSEKITTGIKPYRNSQTAQVTISMLNK